MVPYFSWRALASSAEPNFVRFRTTRATAFFWSALVSWPFWPLLLWMLKNQSTPPFIGEPWIIAPGRRASEKVPEPSALLMNSSFEEERVPSSPNGILNCPTVIIMSFGRPKGPL